MTPLSTINMKFVYRLAIGILGVIFYCGDSFGIDPENAPAESTPIIGLNSEWQYRLAPTEPPANFSQTTFDASAWNSGKAGFGYGDKDDATVVDMGNKTSLAVRHHFELSDGEDAKRLWLAIRYDDAFELWINGKPIFSKGVSKEEGGKLTIKSHEAKDWEYFPLGRWASLMHPTRNCIAIVGHNVSRKSSDFTLDPQLLLSTSPAVSTSQSMDKFRVVWCSDPTTETTVVWNQRFGQPGTVYYGKQDHQQNTQEYPLKQAPQRVEDQSPMTTCIARLTGLEPDTEYFFCIKDDAEVSRRLKFRTAPNKPSQSFTFVAGGDSRNGRKVRVAANRTVEKLRPLFVAFTGDLVVTDSNKRWVDWLDDWQATISKDGHMIPLVPHRGNHEGKPQSIHQTFGTPRDAYYAFSISSDLFRYYALNSEIPAEGKQGDWLDQELRRHQGKVTHLVAGYHKPMRPHVRKKSEGQNPYRWADEFYRYGLDLAIESDSHVMKRTLPLKPDKRGDEGFSHSADDKNATIYIGEGCWGAPLRAADDDKEWTTAHGSFNGFDWLHVTPEHIAVKTVRVGDPATIEPINPEKPFETPEGLQLWQPSSGQVLIVPGDR